MADKKSIPDYLGDSIGQIKPVVNKVAPKRSNLAADLLAGLTFAVANIPTAMAHAIMATVSPVLGIYTLMTATPIAALFTSSVLMNVSTTSALSVSVGSSLTGYAGDQKIQALGTLVFLVGVIGLVLGLLKAGSMMRFVPNSVMVGFINGVAVLIILGQMSDLTGYNSTYSNKVAKTLDMLLHPKLIDWPSLLVGLLTFAVILGLNRTRLHKISALVGLIVASGVVYVFDIQGVKLIRDVATLTGELPKFTLPNFHMLLGLALPALSIAIVGLVQGAAVSQNYPNPNGKFPDTSGDFLGQGIANLVTSFFQGLPAGGSMSGTGLNINSGARSRWTNIFAGVFVILIILFFSPLVNYIPMPALAALVTLAGFQSLHIPAAITVWNTSQVSGVLMALTFVLTLVIPLQYAVLAGVAFSILLFVFQESNRVRITEWETVPNGYPIEKPVPAKLLSNRVTLLNIYGSVFFAASKTIEASLPSPDECEHAVVILGLRGHSEIGGTIINTLWQYSDKLKEHHSKLKLVGINQEIRNKLKGTGFLQELGEENVYMAAAQLGVSLNNAIRDGEAWIKDQTAL